MPFIISPDGVPTLVMHGEDDQIVPGARLKACPGLPHGMPVTHADQINADLLAFIQQ